MAEVLTLSESVWQLLEGISNVNAFDGEFVDANGGPVNPPTDPDGRVHAYAVFYPSPGWSHSMTLDAQPESLAWSFQVTCVGGDRNRVLWCVRKVRGALTGARVGGDVVEEAGDPGPIRRDNDVDPVRFYVPLNFTISA